MPGREYIARDDIRSRSMSSSAPSLLVRWTKRRMQLGLHHY